ncbi:MAG: MFS transporter [Caulobacterales bacterium]
MSEPSRPSGSRISLPGIFAFGSVGLPLAGMLLVFGVYLPRFYVALGVPLAVVGFAVFVVRMLDISLDPIIAFAMDWTRTAIGRYRPWLILGAPIVMLGVYQLLIPPPHAGAAHMIVWMLVAYAGYSMLTLGIASWSALLAPTYNERSRLFGWTQGLAVVGSVALLLLPLMTHGKVVLGKSASMPTVGLILVACIPIAVIICSLFTREGSAHTAARPKFAVSDYAFAVSRPSILRLVLADLVLTLGPGTTGPIYVYFFHDAKGFNVADVGFLLIFYIGAGIAGAPFWGAVAQRFGKHRTVQIACVCYAITQTTLMALPRVGPGGYRFFPDGLPTCAGMFAVGFCASAFILLVRAMVADVVDEVKLEKNRDLTSLLFSLVTTTTKVGQAITVAIVFPILAMVGYNGKEAAVNTPHAIFGLEMCYLFAPIILVFVGGAMLIGYKLDATRHGEIRAALEERDVAAAEESLTGPLAPAPDAAT